jgi:hypothetical protein
MRRIVIVSTIGFCLMAATLAWQPGQTVCAKWSGAYYHATVTAANGDQWDVLYADGDRATLPGSDLHELPGDPALQPGDKVMAIWNNGTRFYSGEVVETCQLSYKVKWDDGSDPTWVPAGKILKNFEPEGQ